MRVAWRACSQRRRQIDFVLIVAQRLADDGTQAREGDDAPRSAIAHHRHEQNARQEKARSQAARRHDLRLFILLLFSVPQIARLHFPQQASLQSVV
jgi:hypothetical protein